MLHQQNKSLKDDTGVTSKQNLKNETGVISEQKPDKIIARKGEKKLGRSQVREEGKI